MKNSKPHILFITPGFPSDEKDTQCIPALQLFVKAIQESEEVYVSVLTFQYPNKSIEYYWNGIRVISLGGRNKKGIARFVMWKKALKTADKINKQTSVDFIHSFWLTECAFIANKLSKKWNIIHSCTIMGQDALSSNRYVKRISPLPKTIALSSYQARELQNNLGINPEHIIPWGTENTISVSLEEKKIDVLGVGNLIPLKAFDRFIDVIQVLQESFPVIKVEIIGSGIEKPRLQKLIESGNLDKNIKLIGGVEREQVLLKMRHSKIFLHMSKYESFGMVLIEALDSGAKVFSTKVGIAEECEGISLVNTNEDIVRKVALYLEAGITVKAKNHFTIDKTVQLYLEKVFI